jgi:WD40 repeat protein
MTASEVTPPNPYVGPRSFETGEALYGRDREVRDLLGLLIAERIVLLHSPSGAGKTSLMQAALIPQLEAEEFTVLPVMRVSLEPPPAGGPSSVVSGHSTTDPPPPLGAGDGRRTTDNAPPVNRYILSLLLSLEEGLPPEQQTPVAKLATLSLDAYLRQHPVAGAAESVVLIFDQFEEILTVDPTNLAAKTAFFAQVGRALRNLQRWALFAMREDYVAALAPYMRPVPTRLNTTYRLDLLGVDAARQAIQQPARLRGVEFEAAAATRLIDDLRRIYVQQPDGRMQEQLGPAVEPVQLQVVCYRLWDRRFNADGAASADGNRLITPADLTAVGDVNRALADYYAERVAAIAQATGVHERAIREWCDRRLITPQGIRSQVLQGEGQSEGLDNRAIRGLIDAYLVRAEPRRGATWFELAHDRLIEPMRADNTTWREAHLSLLQRQADLWDSQSRPDGLLLRDAALADAERWAADRANELTPIERDFLESCRKVREIIRRARRNNRLIRTLAIAALVGLLVAIYFGVSTYRQYQLSQVRLLIAQSAERSNSWPAMALLLSRQANNTADTVETRGALLRTLEVSPHLVAILRDHAGIVWSVAFSPDGKTLASASCGRVEQPSGQSRRCTQGEIRLWDVTTHQLSGQPLGGHSDTIRSVAFSPDGTLLASGGNDQMVILWDVAARRPIASLSGHPAIVWSVAFSPDGKTLASAGCAAAGLTDNCPQGEIRLWDVATHQPIATLHGHAGNIYGVAFSPDGKTLASGGADSTVILWDLAARRPVASLAGHTSRVHTVAFSPDGKTLASGGADAKIILWDVAARRPVGHPLEGHINTVYGVAFSPDGKTLVSGSADHTLILWDLARQQQIEHLTGHPDPVSGVAFNPDGKTIASSSWDWAVNLWDLSIRQRLGDTIATADKPLISTALSPDGRLLAAVGCAQAGACLHSDLVLWDLAGRRPLDPPLADDVAARMVAFSPDGKLLAAATCGQTDPQTGKCSQGQVLLWNMAAHQQGEPLCGGPAALDSLAFSPDGETLACAGDDGAIALWDVATHQRRSQPLHGHDQPVTSLAFSPDGKILASGDASGAIILWDATTGQPRGQPLHGHDQPVTSLAFSPDGKLLASGSSDTTIVLWVAATGQEAGNALQGHTATVKRLAFSPDGATLASAGGDGAIVLWDIESKRQIGALVGHTDEVTGADFSPGGKTLVTGSIDRTIVRWDVDPASWRERACVLANRNLYDDEWAEFVGDGSRQKTCPNLPLP